EHELGFAQPGVVAVAVDEAGDGQPTLEVNDARLRTDPALDLGVGADRGDAVAADGNRLCAWMQRVDGVKVAMQQDEIGTTLLRICGAGHQDGPEEGKEKARRRHGWLQ